jgi:hypothetical protein
MCGGDKSLAMPIICNRTMVGSSLEAYSGSDGGAVPSDFNNRWSEVSMRRCKTASSGSTAAGRSSKAGHGFFLGASMRSGWLMTRVGAIAIITAPAANAHQVRLEKYRLTGGPPRCSYF